MARMNGYRLESLMLAIDLAYESFSAMMWRRIELWKLGTIDDVESRIYRAERSR